MDYEQGSFAKSSLCRRSLLRAAPLLSCALIGLLGLLILAPEFMPVTASATPLVGSTAPSLSFSVSTNAIVFGEGDPGEEAMVTPDYLYEDYMTVSIGTDSPSGAGNGNRTRVTSLEGWNSTIELHPHLR